MEKRKIWKPQRDIYKKEEKKIIGMKNSKRYTTVEVHVYLVIPRVWRKKIGGEEAIHKDYIQSFSIDCYLY